MTISAVTSFGYETLPRSVGVVLFINSITKIVTKLLLFSFSFTYHTQKRKKKKKLVKIKLAKRVQTALFKQIMCKNVFYLC